MGDKERQSLSGMEERTVLAESHIADLERKLKDLNIQAQSREADLERQLAEALEPPLADGSKWGLHTHEPCPACLGHVAGRADLLAENARLQERVDNQEPWLAALGGMLVHYRIARFPEDVLAWRTERDRFKALAERRKEAGQRVDSRLRLASADCHRQWKHRGSWDDCELITCANDKAAMDARAAIEEAP